MHAHALVSTEPRTRGSSWRTVVCECGWVCLAHGPDQAELKHWAHVQKLLEAAREQQAALYRVALPIYPTGRNWEIPAEVAERWRCAS